MSRAGAKPAHLYVQYNPFAPPPGAANGVPV